ncbi:protein Z, vitamin K-dependent plasma glycoprotein a [Synchiropus picturatus]
MTSSPLYAALLGLLLVVDAQEPQTVFLDKQQASAVISRHKRSDSSILEKVCMEKICTYEEARKVFQDSYRTDIFWSVYVDGDQCVDKPCKNGGMCSDSVGGYDCICKSGFTGIHCENDTTLCTLEKDKGCTQFCKPGYTSPECSCAHGWRLNSDRITCVAAVPHPCGKVNSLTQWDEKKTSNAASGYQGVACRDIECPWQAMLKDYGSEDFCSGVILKENLVLTSAQCASKFKTFQVVVGKRKRTFDDYEQTINVKKVTLHPRYVEGRGEYDLAVVELQGRMTFTSRLVSACLPEKDFAENFLLKSTALVTGWKTGDDSPLMFNHLEYESLSQCLQTHPEIITNKMGCTGARANVDCTMGSGSPLLALHRGVVYLTGVLSEPAGLSCSKGYVFQKVSRNLGWIQKFMKN